MLLLLYVLVASLRAPSSDAANLTTRSLPALQATPSPVTNNWSLNGTAGAEPYLLITSPLSINQVRTTGRNLKAVISSLGLANADALDFDLRRGIMYWSDVSRGAIACAKLDGSEQFDVLSTPSQAVGGVAVDWVTRKLYWTDSGAKEILVLDVTTRLGKVIANTGDRSLPRSLAVDPTQRFLYWTDCGSRPIIGRISMDGTSREVLHNTGLGKPNALTIDHGTQTIYWTDSISRDIESSSTDGSGRRTVTSAVFLPYSITVFGDSLYWTDWEYDAIFQATTSGRNVSFLISGLSSRPKGIQLISDQRQPTVSSPCEVNNGGCSHLCLLSNSSRLNYSCACPYGYSPTNANHSNCIASSSASNRTGSCVAAGYQGCCSSGPCLGYLGDCSCSTLCYDLGTCCGDVNETCPPGPSPYVMFTEDESLYNMDLDGNNLHQAMTGLSGASAVDFDYRQGYVYWTELSPPSIWKAAMNGSSKVVLVDRNLTTPAGLAVDWVSNKLYWTDEDQSTIEVLDPVRNRRSILFHTGPSSLPRAIVLDPITRWLYWTDWSSNAKIYRASMDGSNRTVIQDYNLGFPNALALDRASQRLYWGDAGLNHVETSLVDGTQREVLYHDDGLYPYSMVLFGAKLYITNWIGFGVVTVATNGAVDMATIYSNADYYPRGIRVVSWNSQSLGSDPCATNNGGCAHLCLLSSVHEAGYSCACQDGTELNNTRGTCDGVPPTTPPTPVLQGSCRLAGYTTCCPTAGCLGSPQEADCYCDHACHKFRDCCPDISDTCPLLFPPSRSPTPSLSSFPFANTTINTPPSTTPPSTTPPSVTTTYTPDTSHLTITAATHYTTITTSPPPPPGSSVVAPGGISVGLLAAVIAVGVVIVVLLALILVLGIALAMRGRTVSQTYSVDVTHNPGTQAQQLG